MLNGSEKMFSIADNYNAYLRKESREWTRIAFSEEIFVQKKCVETSLLYHITAIFPFFDNNSNLSLLKIPLEVCPYVRPYNNDG